METAKNYQTTFNIKKIPFIFMLLMTIIASIIKIQMGWDIDEAALLSLSAKLVEGQSMFKDLWDVYQTSALIPYVLLKILTIFVEKYEYSVIFFRVCGILISLLVSIFTYHCLKKIYNSGIAIYMSLLFFNFSPRWTLVPDYTNIQMWSLLICSFCLLMLFKKVVNVNKNIFVIVSAVSFSMSILCYPYLLILFPYYLILLIHYQSKKDAFAFFTVCGFCAIVFCANVIQNIELSSLIQQLPYIVHDGSHEDTGKWLACAKEIVPLLFKTIKGMLVGVLLETSLFLIARHTRLRPYYPNRIFMIMNAMIVIYTLSYFVYAVLGKDLNTTSFPQRYIVIASIGIYLFLKNKKENAIIYYTLWIPGIIIYFCSVWASNLGVTLNTSFLYLSCFASLLMLVKYAKNEDMVLRTSRNTQIVLGTICFFILGSLFFKGYLVRETGTVIANITEEREKINYGMAKGVYLYPKDAREYNIYYNVLGDNTLSTDRTLVLSRNPYVGLCSNGKAVGPISHGTVVYDEQWIAYYDKFTHEKPTVVVIDERKVGDIDTFLKSNVFGKWINTHYPQRKVSKNGLMFLR